MIHLVTAFGQHGLCDRPNVFSPIFNVAPYIEKIHGRFNCLLSISVIGGAFDRVDDTATKGVREPRERKVPVCSPRGNAIADVTKPRLAFG